MFSALFNVADKVSGRDRVLYNPQVPFVQDTSAVDEGAANERQQTRSDDAIIQESEPWRDLVRHIPKQERSRKSRDTVLMTNERTSISTNVDQAQRVTPFVVPECLWEKQVKQIMQSDSDDVVAGIDKPLSEHEANSAGVGVVGSTQGGSKFGLRRSIPLAQAGLDDLIAPISCFDVDVVEEGNINSAVPLIPNHPDITSILLEKLKRLKKKQKLSLSAANGTANPKGGGDGDGDSDVGSEDSESSSSSNEDSDHDTSASENEGSRGIPSDRSMSSRGPTKITDVSNNVAADLAASMNEKSNLRAVLSEQREAEKREKAKNKEIERLLMLMMTPEEKKAHLMEKKQERLGNLAMAIDLSKNVNARARNARIDDDVKSSASRGGTASLITHSRIASNHLNIRADLGSSQLGLFHRPRMSRRMRRKFWKIALYNPALQSVHSKNRLGGRAGISSQAGINVTNSGSGSIQSESVNMQVESGEFILVEYFEEHPPLRSNFGMGSKLINYYKAPDTRNTADIEEETNARHEAQRRSLKKQQRLLSSCRLPRHVTKLLSLRDSKQEYEHNAHIPRLPYGVTQVLGPSDESPFLGEIKPGEIQTALVNNLFKAPLFEQRKSESSTDFLMVCTNEGRRGAGDMHFTLREIQRVFVAGQVEPMVRIARPQRDPANQLQFRVSKTSSLLLQLSVAKILAHHVSELDDGIPYQKIESTIFSDYTQDRFWSSQRKSLRDKLQNIVKDFGESHVDRTNGVRLWKAKKFSMIHSDRDLELEHSVEYIAQQFTPEDVCIQESLNSAEFRIRQLGILEALPLQELWAWLQLQGRIRSKREYRAGFTMYLASQVRYRAKVLHTTQHAAVLTAKELNDQRAVLLKHAEKLDQLAKIFISSIKILDQKIETGKFIFDTLAICPWNTTQAYYYGHRYYDNAGRMEVDAQGDPSGVHQAFSFLRIDKSMLEKKDNRYSNEFNSESPEKIQGTNKDLRKLTTIDQIKMCMAFGMSLSDAKKLERWDRISVIRQYTTAAVMSGVMTDSKFARAGGAGGDIASKELLYKEKCEIIWKRQREALQDVEAEVQDDNEVAQSAAAPSETSEQRVLADDDGDSSDSDYDILDEDEDYVESCVTETARIISEKEKRKIQEAKRQSQSAEVEASIITDLMKSLETTSKSTDEESKASLPHGAHPSDAHTIPASSGNLVAPVAQVTRPLMLLGSGAGRAVGPSVLHENEKPTKAVRRTIRTVYADGSEKIEVTFLINAKEVKRVEENKKRVERHAVTKSRLGKPQSVRDRQRVNSIDDDEEDMKLHTPAQTGGDGLSLKVGKMKKVAADDLNKNESFDSYKQKHSTSRGAGFPIYRMPQIAFAALLESELMSLCQARASSEFWMLWNPVPRTVPKYYEVVTNPLSLSELHDNISNYKYLSYRMFCDDLDLVVYNACLFNGETSKLAKKAVWVRDKIKEGLELKRRTLGIDKCPLKNFDDAIRKKYLYLGRPIPQSVPVPLHQFTIPVASDASPLGPVFGSDKSPPHPGAEKLGPVDIQSTIFHSGSTSQLTSQGPNLQRSVSFVPGLIGNTSPSSPSMQSVSGNEYSPNSYSYSPDDHEVGYEYSPSGSPISASPSASDASPYQAEVSVDADYSRVSDASVSASSANGGRDRDQATSQAPGLPSVMSFLPTSNENLMSMAASASQLGTSSSNTNAVGYSSMSANAAAASDSNSDSEDDWMIDDASNSDDDSEDGN